MTKKLLVFLNSFTVGSSGGDVCFAEIYRHMPDVQLTIVTSELGKNFCNSYKLTAKYLITTSETKFSLPFLTYLKRIIFSFRYIKELKNYDIIYSTSDALPDTLPAFIASILWKKRWIGNVFHIIPSERKLSYFFQKISHLFLKMRVSNIFVDSKKVMNDLVKSGFANKILVLRHPAFDVKSFADIKPIKKYTAVTMSRIHPTKGIEDVILIWTNIVKDFNDATLGIIGTGNKTYILKVIDLVHKNKMEDNVQLLGFLNKRTSVALIKGANIFLAPSHEEGFGMAIGDALSVGTPVIAYDLPVYSEIYGNLITSVKKYDIHDLEKKVKGCLNNPYKLNMSEIKNKLKKYSWLNGMNIEKSILWKK